MNIISEKLAAPFFILLLIALGSCKEKNNTGRIPQDFSIRDTPLVTEIKGQEAFGLKIHSASPEEVKIRIRVLKRDGTTVPHHLYGCDFNDPQERREKIILKPGNSCFPYLFVPRKKDVYKIVFFINGRDPFDFYIMGDPLGYASSFAAPSKIEYR